MYNGGAGTPEETRRVLRWADLVVAPSQEAADVWPYTARARVRGETLATLRADHSFVLFRTVQDTAGAPYYLFEKIPFYGFNDLGGLSALEGPYPQWKLGLVRWGLGPETALGIEVERAGRYRLSLDGRPAQRRLDVSFLLDDRILARHAFEDPNTFERVEVPIELPAGKHTLKIAYRQWVRASDGRPLAVLFNSIQMAPDPEEAPKAAR
jgi:hypothetical protein